MQDGPLDMRMDQSAGKSAYDVINTYSEAELYRVIKDYGKSGGPAVLLNLSSGTAKKAYQPHG